MIEDTLSEAEKNMEKAVEAVRKELNGIRTGHANTGLVENIRVDYYGIPTPLFQIATITAPEARLLVVQPWDRQVIGNVEKALLKSDLGLNPASDGTIIRLAIPPLTEERRRELIRVVRKKVEEGRVALRNVRREDLEALRSLEKNKDISEDAFRRASESLQKLTDSFVALVDAVGEEKEAELLTI